MKKADLVKSVKNVLARCGECGGDPEKIELGNLPEAVKCAAALAWARNLTEDDDTRQLRWQYNDLHNKGAFTLEG